MSRINGHLAGNHEQFEAAFDGDTGHTIAETLRSLAAIIESSDPGAGVSSWDDRDYDYTEVKLLEESESDLDLNIHGSSVLIRLSR